MHTGAAHGIYASLVCADSTSTRVIFYKCLKGHISDFRLIVVISSPVMWQICVREDINDWP